MLLKIIFEFYLPLQIIMKNQCLNLMTFFLKKAKINHCHENKKLYKASQIDKLYQ